MSTDRRVPPESDFVFNIVWVGTAFTYLRYFVESQIAHSQARFRFVTNACPPDQLVSMEAFAADHPDRITEILEVSSDEMVPHGEALERVRACRDDGDFFCLIDSDIKASGPFVTDFAEILIDDHVGVTSGRGVWAETDVIPEGHAGVNGEYFFARDGFLFGSPHFAMYRRDAIDAVKERWNIGFGDPGPTMSDEARERLADAGQDYWLYDTGKLVNAFLQFEGGRLTHREHDRMMHVGGMSHYLSPPDRATEAGRKANPDWATWDADRLEVARFSAEVLMASADGRTVPAIPAGVEASMRARLETVRAALIDLVAAVPGDTQKGRSEERP